MLRCRIFERSRDKCIMKILPARRDRDGTRGDPIPNVSDFIGLL